jgi:drug/metabolite transporter (DMT)-like permease
LVLAALLIVAWSSAFAAIRVALEDLGPGHLTATRLLIASLAFAIAAPFLHVRLPTRTELPRLIVCAFFGQACYHLFLNIGEQEVTAATASLLIGTMPVFAALLAKPMLGEEIHRRRWIGIAIAAAGMLLVTFQGEEGVEFEPAALLVLGSAISAAFYTIGQKPLLVHLRPVDTAAWVTWIGALMVLPLLWGFDASQADTDTILALLWLGIVPSAIGYALYAAVLSRMEASAASTLLYLIPPVAAIIAWVWLGETVGALTIIGGAIALVGVAIATRSGNPRPEVDLAPLSEAA